MKTQPGLIILAAIVIFSNFNCPDDIDCPNERDVAQVETVIVPNQKTYRSGDTIWLNSTFDTELELSSSQATVAVDSAQGTLGIAIFKISAGSTLVESGFDGFEVYNKKGTLVPPLVYHKDRAGYIDFDCDNDNCGFNIGLIPRIPGAYCLYLLNGSIYNNRRLCPSLSAFQHNIFKVEDRNTAIYYELNIGDKPLESSGSEGTTHFFYTRDSEGAYIFNVL